VTISRPFHLGVTEVTQRQWKAVMRVRPWEGRDYGVEADDRPVNWIRCSNATVFCAKLSHITRRTVRLPTEAEWEYACRAGSTSDYCFGDDDDQLGQYAWYGWKTPDAKTKCPRQVARKKPNAWGLYDMHGNVWEWCSDWYDRDYYQSTGAEVVDPAGPDSGTNGVLRGGAWHNIPANLRAAKRMDFAKDTDCRSGGLRVVVEIRQPR
jgi:formylglycine-generating enzyme required for sulfatase activity